MDEYKAHILESRCPAKVCINLIKYEITDKCIGCTKCARECPTEAIIGEVKKLHKIIQEKCVKCGTCKEVCPVDAVEVVDNV
jgi:NADH-quinone oxidoreductase subunit F